MDQTYLDKSKKTKVTTASPFDGGPCHGSLDGQPIIITHVGDADGMSPVYLIVGSDGRSAWVPQESVVVTDPRFLPTQTKEAFDSSSQRVPAGLRSGS